MNYNNQKSAFKAKQPSHPNSHPNISNRQTHNLPTLHSEKEKEKFSNEIFFMNPLLIENMSQDELRTQAIYYEYKLLLLYGHDLGIYVVPQLNNFNIWHCVIFIRSGLYKDGKFKFVMEFLKDFPKSKPSVKFEQPIFHPLINPDNNVLDMNYLFPTWKYGSHLIFSVFSEIKNIFTDINYLQLSGNYEGNTDAFIKFNDNIEDFYNRVQEDVEFSRNFLFENSDDSSLKFSEYNTEHEEIRNKLEEVTKEECTWEEKKKNFLSFLFDNKDSEQKPHNNVKK